jgi:ArsR family transcriptional regulator
MVTTTTKAPRDMGFNSESSAVVGKMAAAFKILSDPSRLNIVLTLQEHELCVQELADRTSLSQSLVSHHLHSLRLLNLVKHRREGKKIIYSLSDSHVSALLAVAHDHARE